MRGAAKLLSVTAVVVLLALAAGCENENAAACNSFVAHHQSLPCAEGIDPGVDCNAFADYPCPIVDYFTCLEQGHTCNEEGQLVVDVVLEDGGPGQSTCADLLDCER